MTRTELVNTLNALGNDVFYSKYKNDFNVTIIDADWGEINRDFDNPQAVEDFEKALENKCNYFEGDYCKTYYFDDFTVWLGRASYDI